MMKQVTDKKWSSELYPGTTGLNIVIDNPESVVESWVQSLVTILYDYLLGI